MQRMSQAHGTHAAQGLLLSPYRSILHCNNNKKRQGNARDRRAFEGDDPMAYVPSATSLRDIPLTHAPAQKSRGLFSRLLAAMMVSRQRQAEREIARYLAGSGGKFTDETEREIERRFLSQSYW
jgi:hypothetical protein